MEAVYFIGAFLLLIASAPTAILLRRERSHAPAMTKPSFGRGNWQTAAT